MSKLSKAYELGRRQAVQDHMEKVAVIGLLRSAGSLVARGARSGYRAAAPRVSGALKGTGARNLYNQSKYIAKDTLKSPMTYAFGGLNAYTTEGSAWDKTKAALIGGGIGMGSYKVMGGAFNRALSVSRSPAANKRYMEALMSKGLSKKDAYKATVNSTRASRAAKAGDIKAYDQYKKNFKDATSGLKFRDRIAIGIKYDKGLRRAAAGTAAFVGSGLAAEKATGAISNIAGVGEQQQNRMYEEQSKNYPTPAPLRSNIISGNNNPYSR